MFRWFGVYFGGFRHVEEFGVAGGLLVFLGFLAGEGAVVGAGEGSFLLLGVGFGLAARGVTRSKIRMDLQNRARLRVVGLSTLFLRNVHRLTVGFIRDGGRVVRTLLSGA